MATRASPVSLLVADDDPAVWSWLMERGAEAGWRTRRAAPGEEALAVLSKEGYDLVVTDLLLPGLDGARLLERIHEESPTSSVLIVTAHGSPERAIELIRRGAADYFTKPLDMGLFEVGLARAFFSASKKRAEKRAYRSMEREVVETVLRSSELDVEGVPFPLLDRLYLAGRIDLKTKKTLAVAYQEAITNAHEHGNLELASVWKDEVNLLGVDTYSLLKQERLQDAKYGERLLRVRTEYDGARVVISVRDEGPGFLSFGGLPSGAPAPTFLSSHGRGLTIIKRSMDEVRHSDGGSEITMVKHLGPRK